MAKTARLLSAWDGSDRALLVARWWSRTIVPCSPGGANAIGIGLFTKLVLSDPTYTPGSITSSGFRARVTVSATV